MKILHVSAEVAPYVAVGGLSQVLYYLPRALEKRGHDVRIFTPKYGTMKIKLPDQDQSPFTVDVRELRVPVANDNLDSVGAEKRPVSRGNGKDALAYGGAAPLMTSDGTTAASELVCNVLSLPVKKGEPVPYFLENREYFEMRANVFGYSDDHTRFALLSKGCLEWLGHQHELMKKGDKKAWWPDIIHCHDWHTSYFVDLARHDRRYRKLLADLPIVLTVHNFKYQGNMDFRYAPEGERDTGLSPLLGLTDPGLLKQNALKRGLLNADAITTVSPTHAIEIMTLEYAQGLEDVMELVRGKLSGILNGIDTVEFNPATDRIIHKRFNGRSFKAARAENKKNLQQLFSLPLGADRPLLASVGRLSSQKGLDLIAQTMLPLLEERPDVQLIVVGGGDERFRQELEALQARFPKQVGLHLQTDFILARKTFSGADLILMPSVFEPGGIVAIEALRYGAVPLVRRTGGLNDSVQDFDPDHKRGNGFSFVHKNVWALYGAIISALTVYRQSELWEKLVANCLADDFSWSHAAARYDDWYEEARQEHALSMRRYRDAV